MQGYTASTTSARRVRQLGAKEVVHTVRMISLLWCKYVTECHGTGGRLVGKTRTATVCQSPGGCPRTRVAHVVRESNGGHMAAKAHKMGPPDGGR